MQFVPSFLMATFFIQSCASLSCKMESHSFNVCRWKTEKRSDKLQPCICKKSRILQPSWRKHSKIHLKILLRTTAKRDLWKCLCYHYVEITWKILPLSYMDSSVHSAYFAVILVWKDKNKNTKATFRMKNNKCQKWLQNQNSKLCVSYHYETYFEEILHFKDSLK